MKRQDKIVYLAGPYTHRMAKIRQKRYETLTMVSAKLLEMGIINFSPITHSHNQQIHLENFSTGFDDWRRNDLAFVSRCDEVYVALIPGWDKSYGVKEELAFARQNNVPIKYIDIKKDNSLVILDELPSSSNVLSFKA
jgi:nucleoside 2-deoxyribosyltransferase